MIAEWETKTLFVSDLLEEREPALVASLQSALEGVPIDFIPGTADIWCRDYMPIQLDQDHFCQFVYAPDWIRFLIVCLSSLSQIPIAGSLNPIALPIWKRSRSRWTENWMIGPDTGAAPYDSPATISSNGGFLPTQPSAVSTLVSLHSEVAGSNTCISAYTEGGRLSNCLCVRTPRTAYHFSFSYLIASYLSY